MHYHDDSSVLRDQDLEGDNEHPDGNEHEVFEDSLADINLVVNLSCADHVEDLHQHESCEDPGGVS